MFRDGKSVYAGRGKWNKAVSWTAVQHRAMKRGRRKWSRRMAPESIKEQLASCPN